MLIFTPSSAPRLSCQPGSVVNVSISGEVPSWWQVCCYQNLLLVSTRVSWCVCSPPLKSGDFWVSEWIWFYLWAHGVTSSAVLLDTLIQVSVESWTYFSWQLKESVMFGLIYGGFLWDRAFLLQLSHLLTSHESFQLNFCLHFKQMKAYFNVYDLLKQTIGRGRLKFWA